MSCLADLTKHASVVFFLTHVKKPTQQIGGHIGDPHNRHILDPFLPWQMGING
jgi:hypothetical protein